MAFTFSRAHFRRALQTGILIAPCLCFAACGDDDEVLDASVDAAEDTMDAEMDTSPPPPECEYEGEYEEIADPPLYSPPWAFEPWISKDISDRDDTESFIEGFLSRDIPVGAVVLDSPWETHYNTLIPNPDRYPDFEGLVDQLHEQNIRIVLWTTQMINRTGIDAEIGGDTYIGPASNFQEGRTCDFYVNDGQLYFWWKGDGAGIDFFNEQAVAWWREQQDLVLGMGIDGWKLDFGEVYIRTTPGELPPVQTAQGEIDFNDYSAAYYQEFLRYGVRERGRDFLTMVRGYDVSYDHPARFYARPEHAPVVWMGDNHRDWGGVLDVLDHTFRSAREGYVVIGSDIGGYLDRDENDLTMTIPFDQEVFARWTALSGMMPFFQLHGRANLEPWNIEERTEETIELYRYWANLHSEMVPFWFSLAQEAYAGGDNIVQPVGDDARAWRRNGWLYRVGDAFLVAPVLEAGGIRNVPLSDPAATAMYDYWDESAAPRSPVEEIVNYEGATERGRIPIFIRAGAIVPMHIRSEFTQFGRPVANGRLTLAIWPDSRETTFNVHHEEGEATPVTANGGTITIGAAPEPLLLRVRREAVTTNVQIGGEALEAAADSDAFDALDADGEGWIYDADAKLVWIVLPASETERTITLEEADAT